MKSLKNLICYMRKNFLYLKKLMKIKNFRVIINRKTHKVEGIVTDGTRRSFLSGTSLKICIQSNE